MTIDILIPTANSSNTIHTCLSSILLASSLSPISLRVLISDGSSSDSTLSIVESFSKSLDISIISYSDNGPEDALNKLFKASSSDYIMPLGSDDMISPNYFISCSKLMPTSPTLHFPRFYTEVKFDKDNKQSIHYYFRKTRMGLWLRYTNPGFGFGWIAPRKLISSLLYTYKRPLFSDDQVTYATDSELFLFLLANKFKFSTTVLGNSIFFYGSNGRSSQNTLIGCRESCNLFSRSAGFLSFDIYIFYLLYFFKLKFR